MSATLLRRTTTVITGAAMVCLAASTAHASQLGASYQLSISDRSGVPVSTATLTCHPNGGSHPDPDAACAQIETVQGDFTAMTVDSGPCTLQYDPVTVRAEGLFNGNFSVYEETFANDCVANRETGGVLFNLTA